MAQVIERNQSKKNSGFQCGYALLVLTALMGCGNSLGSTVKGKLMVAGQPLSRGIIAFQPAAGRGSLATADVNPDGTFQLRTGQNRSLPPGEYVVTVLAVVGDIPVPTAQNPHPHVEHLVHERYCHKETSGLKYTIASGENVINIDLDPPR